MVEVTRARRLLVMMAAAVGTAVLHAQQQPTFKVGAELVSIDVQVVDDHTHSAVDNLDAAQFDVRIDGKSHDVESIQFVRTAAAAHASLGRGTRTTSVEVLDGAIAEPRAIVIGVDEASLPTFGTAAAREAAKSILSKAAPADLVGYVGYPNGKVIAPTRDREAVQNALSEINGGRPDLPTLHNLSASEAAALKSKDAGATKDVYHRECPTPPLVAFALEACQDHVYADATSLAGELELEAASSMNGLHNLMARVGTLPGRKTVIVVSAGVATSSQPGWRPDVNLETASVAREAIAANVNLYVLYLDVHFIHQFDKGKTNLTLFSDIAMFARGLEQFAGAAGGTFYQVETGPDLFVDRILSETAGYYLLGVKPLPAERDGKQHFITVKVTRKNTTVRSRSGVVIPKAGG